MTERNEVLAFLDDLVSSDEELRREAAKERVRLALALAMVRARKARGLSQTEVAERLGVSQSWVSKLENPDIAHTFESILDYLQAIDAELDMEIRAGEETFTVSMSESSTSVAAPAEDPGSTFVEKLWEGPTREPSRTFVLFFSSRKIGLRHPDSGMSKPSTRLRYPELSTSNVVASESTTSGYGGSYDLVH
ncbi:MAG: helix-turn-helix domain-containing protein [Acidobacteria bacterium]|nr:helix-turn-helix domain-containing protein [Acidobacteriota bacterium]